MCSACSTCWVRVEKRRSCCALSPRRDIPAPPKGAGCLHKVFLQALAFPWINEPGKKKGGKSSTVLDVAQIHVVKIPGANPVQCCPCPCLLFLPHFAAATFYSSSPVTMSGITANGSSSHSRIQSRFRPNGCRHRMHINALSNSWGRTDFGSSYCKYHQNPWVRSTWYMHIKQLGQFLKVPPTRRPFHTSSPPDWDVLLKSARARGLRERSGRPKGTAWLVGPSQFWFMGVWGPWGPWPWKCWKFGKVPGICWKFCIWPMCICECICWVCCIRAFPCAPGMKEIWDVVPCVVPHGILHVWLPCICIFDIGCCCIKHAGWSVCMTLGLGGTGGKACPWPSWLEVCPQLPYPLPALQPVQPQLCDIPQLLQPEGCAVGFENSLCEKPWPTGPAGPEAPGQEGLKVSKFCIWLG